MEQKNKNARGKEYYKNLKKSIYNMLHEKIIDPEQIKNCMKHYTIKGVYNYSFLNSLLITIQGGTIAQAFHRWKQAGRSVKAGEKARIYIYVPFICKKRLREGGEEEEKVLRGFSVKPVFDISQTQGKPLEYEHNTEGQAGITFKRIKKYAEGKGFEVIVQDMQNGRGSTNGKEIKISKLSNEIDKTKTLFHELGHCIFKHVPSNLSASHCETEAELFAYVMMNMFNYDYALSSAYVRDWRDSQDKINIPKILKECENTYNDINNN